ADLHVLPGGARVLRPDRNPGRVMLPVGDVDVLDERDEARVRAAVGVDDHAASGAVEVDLVDIHVGGGDLRGVAAGHGKADVHPVAGAERGVVDRRVVAADAGDHDP